MSLVMLGIAAFLVYLGYVLGRSADVPSGRVDVAGPRDQADAERLLEQRLARGEIDADEYAQRIDVLHRSRS
jgi:uncharacterized membrane protein